MKDRYALNGSKIELTKEKPGVALCLEYVEDEHKSTFKAILKTLKVFLSAPTVVKTPFKDHAEWEVNRYLVTMERNGESISFHFFDSRNNFEQRLRPNLYDVLACCGADYFCPDNFKDFCDEYGYNEDSRKDHATFIKCQEQAAKLHNIFTDEDAMVLPR